MIQEERVKELVWVAIYDENEDADAAKSGKYYQKDYVAREMLKSFFAATLTYALILALCALNVANSILEQLNTMDFGEIAVYLGVSYLVFLALYLLVTYLVYQVRYSNSRKKMKQYSHHLKKIQKMYLREDRLKM